MGPVENPWTAEFFKNTFFLKFAVDWRNFDWNSNRKLGPTHNTLSALFRILNDRDDVENDIKIIEKELEDLHFHNLMQCTECVDRAGIPYFDPNKSLLFIGLSDICWIFCKYFTTQMHTVVLDGSPFSVTINALREPGPESGFLFQVIGPRMGHMTVERYSLSGSSPRSFSYLIWPIRAILRLRKKSGFRTTLVTTGDSPVC